VVPMLPAPFEVTPVAGPLGCPYLSPWQVVIPRKADNNGLATQRRTVGVCRTRRRSVAGNDGLIAPS
jgi:hypothetical protein